MTRRLIKILIILSLFIAGALCIAGLVLLQYLPTIKDSIQRELSAALGAKVSIQAVQFGLRPTPRLLLEGLTITFPGSCTPTVTAQHMVADINLRRLLHRQVVIENLAVEAPRIVGSFSQSGLSFAGSTQSLCPNNALATEATPIVVVSPPPTQPPAPPPEAAPQWEVLLSSLEVTSGVLSLSTPSGELQLSDLRLISSLEYLGARLLIGESTIQAMLGKLPVGVNASNSSINLQSGDFELQHGTISIAGQTLSVSGTWLAGEAQARISTTNFSLDKVGKLISNELRLPPAPISGGKISANLSISSSLTSKTPTVIAGSFKATEIKTTIPHLSLESMELDKLKLSVGKEEIFEASSTVSLGPLKIVSGRDHYSSESTSGPLSYRTLSAGQKQYSGTVSLQSFQFKNDQTRVSDVVGTISNLTAIIDRRGNIVIKGAIKVSALKLQDPSIVIEKLQSMSAPIEVSIPTSGAYKVSGPVTYSGVTGAVLDRPITDVIGTVSMLISKAIKQFQSQSIAAVIEGQPVKLKTELLIKEGQYILKPSTITLGKGIIGIEASLRSSAAHPVSARITAENVLLRDLFAVASIKSTTSEQAVLSHFLLIASGNMTDFIQSTVGVGGLEITEPGSGFKRFSQRLLSAIASIPLAGIPLRAIESSKSDGQKTVSGDFTVRNGSISTDKLVLNLPYSTVTAKGSIDSAGNLKAKATAIFLQKSFSDFGIGFDRLGKLLGRAGKIEIPVLVSGQVSDPRVDPDLVQLAKNNSGLPLLRDVLKKTGSIAEGIMDGVVGVFKPSSRQRAN